MKENNTGKAMCPKKGPALAGNKSWNKASGITIGIDIGDRQSAYCILDAEGDVLSEGTTRTTEGGFEQPFQSIKPCRIALETGTHSPWISRLLQSYGHEVIVANARQVRVIYESNRKNDKVDARTRARLARFDKALLCPILHRSEQAQADLAMLRARDALVQVRTKLINCVRGMIKSVGGRLPSVSGPCFARKVGAHLPEAVRAEPVVKDPLGDNVAIIFRPNQSTKALGIGTLPSLLGLAGALLVPALAQSSRAHQASVASASEPVVLLPPYKALQRRLASGWNTWDVNSVLTQVLLPEGLAIHLSLKHNSTLDGDALLTDALIGRLSHDAEQVFPGPHAWDGSYTDARVVWKGHGWRVQSAHDGQDLILLATPLPSESKESLAPTIIFSVNFLWNKTGSATKRPGVIETRAPAGAVRVYCTCEPETGIANSRDAINISPLTGPYFAADFTGPVGLGTGKRRSLAEIQATIERRFTLHERSSPGKNESKPIADAIETTLGWDTIFEPEKQRVVSPVSRGWSVRWGGYVIFDWDTFFAATLASVGDRDLAYADAVETLRESTTAGFVPNYARAGNWKSFDRSEPPVGSITVLGLYRKFGEKWLLSQCFPALLQWNRWWAQHRDIQGYLTWGSDGDNPPGNLDDITRGTRVGAILESGLDNSPMYDDATFDAGTHLLQFADVGLMGLYIADCDALAAIADELHNTTDAREIRIRGKAYREKLQTLWSAESGIFLNKDLHTGKFSPRLSPTNFYPMLAHAATPSQAQEMVGKHLLNPGEFWGEWVIPSIARDDPAFKDQNYWRGRIWGPMNYLIYLGLQNYDLSKVRAEFAAKSYGLFLKEWGEHGHVHENYNAILGSGDDVSSSDRFYHWGALLGFTEYLQENERGPSHK